MKELTGKIKVSASQPPLQLSPPGEPWGFLEVYMLVGFRWCTSIEHEMFVYFDDPLGKELASALEAFFTKIDPDGSFKFSFHDEKLIISLDLDPEGSGER